MATPRPQAQRPVQPQRPQGQQPQRQRPAQQRPAQQRPAQQRPTPNRQQYAQQQRPQRPQRPQGPQNVQQGYQQGYQQQYYDEEPEKKKSSLLVVILAIVIVAVICIVVAFKVVLPKLNANKDTVAAMEENSIVFDDASPSVLFNLTPVYNEASNTLDDFNIVNYYEASTGYQAIFMIQNSNGDVLYVSDTPIPADNMVKAVTLTKPISADNKITVTVKVNDSTGNKLSEFTKDITVYRSLGTDATPNQQAVTDTPNVAPGTGVVGEEPAATSNAANEDIPVNDLVID